MEWFFNNQSPVLVQVTLFEICWHFISVDDVPCLTNFAVFVVDSDVSVFSINISLDSHDLSFVIDKHIALPSEELEPSSIGGSHVQVVRVTIALDGDRSGFPLVRLNGLSLIIQVEHLSFVGCSQGLESQIMSTDAFDNSVHPHL